MARISDRATGDSVLLQLGRFQLAHAVLGRERAAKLRHRVVHQGIDAWLLLAQEGFAIGPFRRLHVVVQVAVAQMAKFDQAHAGNLALRAAHRRVPRRRECARWAQKYRA